MVRDNGSLNRFRGRLLAVPVLFVLLLFVVPLVAVGATALQEGPDRVWAVLTAGRTWRVVGFTIWQAALSTVATLLVSLPAAVALARFRFPGRALVRSLVLVPFVLPTVVVGAAFMALIGPNGLAGVDLSGSLVALVAAHMFLNVAVVVRTVAGALATMDPRLEDAARLLGRTRWQAFRQVTWPPLRPVVETAAAVVFLFCFTSFGVVMVLGAGRLRTVEVEIYRSTAYEFDLPVAATLALLQLVVVLAMLLVLRRRRAHAVPMTVDPATRPVGAQRWFVAIAIGVLLVIVLTPLVVLMGKSVVLGGDWTTAGWRSLFVDTGSVAYIDPARALLASLKASLAATAIALVVGGLAAAGLSIGRRTAWATAVDGMLLLPLGTSAVTVGLGLLMAFGRPPADLRGTGLLIPLAQALVAVPFVVRTLSAAAAAFDRRLLDAAHVLGMSPGRALRRVVLPLLLPAVLVAAGFAFAVTLGEFGATVFLVRATSPTLPVAIARILAKPGEINVAQAYAASVLLMLVAAVVVSAVDQVRVGKAVF